MRILCLLFSLVFVSKVFAFSWADLWLTPNQQAQLLMKKGQYQQAASTFQQPDWRATATYRAGEYKQAAKQFKTLQNESGFYNRGNALAHLGKYEQAIKAYDAALALNPKDQDALFNRKLVQDLLQKNKDQQNQNQQNQNQQNKDQQNQNQQDQNQQNKDQQNQNQQDQNQQNKDQQNQNQQDQNQQNKDQQNQNQQDQNQQNKDEQNQNKQDKNQQNKDEQGKKSQNKDELKQDEATKANAKAADKKPTPEELEKQQAKDQWLRLIPDDPAGLLREKFLRDHLRREEGWYQ